MTWWYIPLVIVSYEAGKYATRSLFDYVSQWLSKGKRAA